MTSRKTAISRQFNRSAAGLYDSHAHVQSIMADRLAHFVRKGTGCDGDSLMPDILEIGCGTGTLTEMLVNDLPCSAITALDLAPAMIQTAEQRIRPRETRYFDSSCKQPPQVQFLQADVEKWAAAAPAASFDLIVSSACFQWLSHPKETLEHLRRLLRAGGLLAFATFGPDTFRELHAAFDEVYHASGMKPQRHGLSFQSADQWISLLKESGFLSIQEEQLFQTEEHASVRDFLLSVKALGASTSEAAAASPGLGSRRLFANMYQAYEDKFSTPGGVATTYEMLFIQARL